MDKRTKYVEELSARMMDWDVQIDLLKDRAAGASPEAQAEYSAAIAALKLKRDEAALKLQGIGTASDDEWGDVKAGTDQVWDEVSSMLHAAIMKIK